MSFKLSILSFIGISILTIGYKSSILRMSNFQQTNAIVVGTGLAGLTAAISLAEKGYNVVILEKSAKYGGNSIKASSGINGAPTKYQPVRGDSVDKFVNDILKSGKGLCNEKLVDVLASKSADAIYWLEGYGVNLQEVAQLGGHSMPRTHRGNNKVAPGYSLISHLISETQQSDRITIKYNCSLSRILKDGKRVSGVEYTHEGQKFKILADNVFLATGGFAADTETTDSLIKKYRPELAELPTTNADSISGDGHKIASRDCKVKLIDMSEIQTNPTGFVDLTVENANARSKILCAELIRGIGGILLSPNTGKRFVDEMQTRDVVSNAVYDTCQVEESALTVGQKYISIIVVDPKDLHKAETHLNFYISRNLLHLGTVEDLANFIRKINKNFKDEWLFETFMKYNRGIEGTDEFGRTVFGSSFTSSKFYFGATTPVLHFSMGGIAINEQGKVYDENNQIIDNFYAIGEIAAGVHGKNRLGGNSLLECVVFGREAADSVG